MTLLHFLAWSSKSRPANFEPYIGGGRSNFMGMDNRGRSILHFAAQRGNTLILEHLFKLQSKIDARHKDNSGRSLLHYAVESRRIEIIDMMVSRKVDIRATDNNGRTILHQAAKWDNLAAVKRVIELGGEQDLWAADDDGRTPLQLALIHRATAVTEYLGGLRYYTHQNENKTGKPFPTYICDPKITRNIDHATEKPSLQARLGFKKSLFCCSLIFVLMWYFLVIFSA